jgi:hypothetical protein
LRRNDIAKQRPPLDFIPCDLAMACHPAGSDSRRSRSCINARSRRRTASSLTDARHAWMRSGGSSDTRSTSIACVRAPDSSRPYSSETKFLSEYDITSWPRPARDSRSPTRCRAVTLQRLLGKIQQPFLAIVFRNKRSNARASRSVAPCSWTIDPATNLRLRCRACGQRRGRKRRLAVSLCSRASRSNDNIISAVMWPAESATVWRTAASSS